MMMEREIKRCIARHKSTLVLEIFQGKTTASEATRQFDLAPFGTQEWVEHAKAGMENALPAKPEEVREQRASAQEPAGSLRG